MLARELFDKMLEKGCLSNEFSTLLHGYCRKGKLSKANAIVNEMMRNGCVPNTCNIFLHSLWKEGKILETEYANCIKEKRENPRGIAVPVKKGDAENGKKADSSHIDKVQKKADINEPKNRSGKQSASEINGSLARKAIRELMARGLIRLVSAHSSQQIYTRATNT
ncbi:hypothetical protein GOBAR_DD22734 [Gossypium barbadense]|nr:hypothetical protein GOBAR_DD22734 [Gossypium barbadense]